MQYQSVYGDYKFIYFSGCLYVINIKNVSISKRIFDVEKVYFLNNGIIALIRKISRRDEMVSININDLSVESMGYFKIADVMR